jgi:hypothetical protein
LKLFGTSTGKADQQARVARAAAARVMTSSQIDLGVSRRTGLPQPRQ